MGKIRLTLNTVSNLEPSGDVNIGAPAPDFHLPDEQGREWRLSDRRGKVVALLFYPGDETLVCTKQLCSVRDNWADYVATGAEVVAVSPGTVESHLRFSEHHSLPLPLLADASGDVTKTYSAHWLMPSWATRAVVIIDAKGVIRSRQVMLRAFRPSDAEVIAAIRLAQYDILVERRRR
ncbi:MAG: peroxiredoxin [Pyrinomonadaceae bacterium]